MDDRPDARRLRVCISAYAFGPCDESEASAGWAFAVAAAANHDVWVITRYRFQPEIEAALAADPALAEHLHVHYLDHRGLMKYKRGQVGVYWYYFLWQRQLAKRVRQLHERHDFDLVHHVTFASDWLPCGLLGAPDLPLVWGPVGGATTFPHALAKWVGRRYPGEVFRDLSTGAMRRIWSDPLARRAQLVVCQNADVATRFERLAKVIVEPNAAFREAPAAFVPGELRVPKHAIFVGRLVGWKGVRIALTALADPRLADWTLDFYGAGEELDWLTQEADRLGISERVRFLGLRPRTEVLAAFGSARLLLFPSLHDSAGWVAGEASSAGCPVVCLDVGGPVLLAGPNGFPVKADRNVLEGLVQAVLRAAEHPGEPYHRWQLERLPPIVDAWYRQAMDDWAARTPS